MSSDGLALEFPRRRFSWWNMKIRSYAEQRKLAYGTSTHVDVCQVRFDRSGSGLAKVCRRSLLRYKANRKQSGFRSRWPTCCWLEVRHPWLLWDVYEGCKSAGASRYSTKSILWTTIHRFPISISKVYLKAISISFAITWYYVAKTHNWSHLNFMYEFAILVLKCFGHFYF